MNLFRNLCLIATTAISVAAFAEPPDPSAPEVAVIQNVEFEVSNSSGGWVSLGSDRSPEFMKSISIKYKVKDGSLGAANVSEGSLRESVKLAAEEKCRLLGASDRPAELSSTATLRLSADISSQQVVIGDQDFTGKYLCAVNLKP